MTKEFPSEQTADPQPPTPLLALVGSVIVPTVVETARTGWQVTQSAIREGGGLGQILKKPVKVAEHIVSGELVRDVMTDIRLVREDARIQEDRSKYIDI